MFNHDESSIQVMQAFVEGKINIQAFKHEFDTNPLLKMTLRNDPLCPKDTYYLLPEDKDIIRHLEMIDWSKTGGQLNVWGEVERFLLRYKRQFTPTNYYRNRHSFLLAIQPRWLDITNEDYLNSHVISKIPNDITTKTKKVAWCKSRLKELFQYDKNPPRWVQSPEWPIIDGKPLVFKKQIAGKVDTERVDFLFSHPDTGEEHVVTQWY